MDPGTHFAFGTHPHHGFVASATSHMSSRWAHWLLVREQFEPVDGQPGLFRLAEPERDGPRRTRQAVHDLRRHGYAVHADVALDPAASADPPRPVRPHGLSEQRSRIAQAAGRSSQRRSAPTTARPVPPKPAYAPTVHLPAAATGRSR
ncbi:hypothetical protein A6A06_01525 [Streptomyces sp. CB02923]|uniref:hypothetical protein n=1 Tax=Streptomyces sp. CB02923 TaxID=1718985 RepID=UPI00093BA4CB|nr:hypothetical protein [Streptomyces sp. CB02923]OKI09414.1 hypothetical protein A6A06_01525 [Streptomyces sp. CB02923]